MKAKRILLLVFMIGLFSNYSMAQFIGGITFNQTPDHEVRKGSTVSYSVADAAVAGEQFRWEVTGGVIDDPAATGAGIIGDPSVLDFTVDKHTLNVTWSADDNNIVSTAGTIKVQKKTTDGCASEIRDLNILQWSNPTVQFDASVADNAICSGNPSTNSIQVNFTGAPDFSYSYEIIAPDLIDDNGDPVSLAETTVDNISADNATIALPNTLINTVNNEDRTFTVRLTAMHDAFEGDGAIVGSTDFVITVHPTTITGPIEGNSLNRR